MKIDMKQSCDTCGRNFYTPESFHAHKCSKDMVDPRVGKAMVYERDVYLGIDPASPDGDKCIRVWWFLNASGKPEILKYEEVQS